MKKQPTEKEMYATIHDEGMKPVGGIKISFFICCLTQIETGIYWKPTTCPFPSPPPTDPSPLPPPLKKKKNKKKKKKETIDNGIRTI